MSFFNWRARRNDDLGDEIQSHLRMDAADRIARGESVDDARAGALREFGNVTLIKETTREMWRWNIVDQIIRDVRYAFRTLGRSRAFSIAAILTLAVGIAAATVIFSVTDHVVLRSLPYPQADRLFAVQEVILELRDTYPTLPANASHFLEWQRRCTACESMGAIGDLSLTRSGTGDPQVLSAVRLSPNVLPMLGAHAQFGRLLTTTDDEPGRERVLVLSNKYWRRAFGSDTAIIGRTLTLSDNSWQIVGVLAADFAFPRNGELGIGAATLPAETEMFAPLAFSERQRTTPGEFNYSVIFKLAKGATLARAKAEISATERAFTERNSDKMTFQAAILPLQQQMVGNTGRALLFLLAAVGAILLIVCVNLTNLLLARHAERVRESAVRVALGANPGRLVWQALTESLVLAVLGGAIGIAASRWGLQLLLKFAPSNLPRLPEIQLDGRVVAVAMLLSLTTGLVFGVVPALRFGRVNPADVLKSGGRTHSGSRVAKRTRNFLIASQVGLSTTLLYATGLFLSSFVRVLHVDKGFTEQRVLALDVALYGNSWNASRRAAFYDEVIQRLAGTSGVKFAGIASKLPLEGEQQVDALSRENETRVQSERPTANIRYVNPEYFGALGIVPRLGRVMSSADRGHNVVMLSERAARALWPAENPIGKRVQPGENDSIAEVIGIVPDVRTTSIERPGSLAAYIPYWQHAPPTATLLVSTAGDALALTTGARAAVRAANKSVPVSNVRTMEQVVSAAVAVRRFQLLLLMLFAASALVTACVGIYGIISHALVRRNNEIGVRMALGARAIDVQWLVLKETLKPVGYGVVSGVFLSVVLGQLVRSLLFEVKPADPLTIAVVPLMLALVAVAACFVPARRATLRGPALALRAD